MDGSALEVALALMRMPSMRVVLRCRPLPDGVGEVIELAAGAPERVAEAAARSGESPADVLEAVRFYVREVLLFAGADAYRVLGVAPGAPDAQVRQHHRHLQQWLHPDRDEEGWESVFAARINAAWAELRSPSRRAAYDARRALEPDAGPDESRRVLVSDWRPTRAADDQRWRRWVLPVAAVACCLWLVVLAARQNDAPGPRWQASSGQEEGALELSESTIAAVAAVAAVPVAVVSPVEAEDGLMATQPADGLLATLQDSDAIAVRSAAVVARDALRPAVETVGAQASASNGNVTAAIIGTAGNPSPPNPPLEGEDSVRGVATTGMAEEFAASGAVAEETGDDVGVASAKAGAGASISSSSSSSSSSSPAPAPVLALAPVSAPAVAVVPAPAVTISPQRVQLVQRIAGDLTDYLVGDARRAPPIWNTAAAQDAAASLRKQLDGARLGDADWHVGAERARMISAVERRGQHDAPAVLRAEFAWREGLWLVDALSVEESQ